MQDVFFTTKVATAKTFCDREQEKLILITNLKKGQHTVVVAPRRHGKTSLICNTLSKLDYPFAKIDFFCVVYEEDVCQKIAKGISELINKIMSFSEKTLKVIEHYFKGIYIGIKAGRLELKIGFTKTARPLAQLEDLLTGLEKLAKKQKKKVILFFDEFQDVLKIDETNKLQAAIRTVAQHSQYVTYIFSGSSRRMLKKIFDDRNQPLYMLCSKIILDKIPANYFSEHIKKASVKRWKSALNDNVISEILKLTEAHPFYVNMLCDNLFDLKQKPTVDDVNRFWDKCLIENKGKIIANLEPLNTNRIKVIIIVSLLGNVTKPNGKLFLDKVKLPLGSVQKAVKYLMDYDYLYKSEEGLRLVDPLMRKFIIERYRD